jgi:hypothetical protein
MDNKKIQSMKDLKNAISYLQRALSTYGGQMVGEANRVKGLDFYKWKLIIAQVLENSERVREGLLPLEIAEKYSLDDVLGRTNSIKGIFTEK